jgi:hypothetical protein
MAKLIKAFIDAERDAGVWYFQYKGKLHMMSFDYGGTLGACEVYDGGQWQEDWDLGEGDEVFYELLSEIEELEIVGPFDLAVTLKDYTPDHPQIVETQARLEREYR